MEYTSLTLCISWTGLILPWVSRAAQHVFLDFFFLCYFFFTNDSRNMLFHHCISHDRLWKIAYSAIKGDNVTVATYSFLARLFLLRPVAMRAGPRSLYHKGYRGKRGGKVVSRYMTWISRRPGECHLHQLWSVAPDPDVWSHGGDQETAGIGGGDVT